jgi:hypothetical protein
VAVDDVLLENQRQHRSSILVGTNRLVLGAFLFWAFRGGESAVNFTWPAMHFTRMIPSSITYRLGGALSGQAVESPESG